MKRKREARLDKLAEKGLTLDENSRVVRMDNGDEAEEDQEEHNNMRNGGVDSDDSGDDSSDDSSDNDSSSEDETVQVATSKAKTKSFKSNAAAAKPKHRQMKPKSPSKESNAIVTMRKQLNRQEQVQGQEIRCAK